MHARIHGEIAVLHRPAEDHSERHEGIPDRRRVAALSQQIVEDPLGVAVLNVAEAHPASDGTM
jgi:hypothetical protein